MSVPYPLHPIPYTLPFGRARSGTVGLDFFDGCDEYDLPARAPVLLLIHGLAGSSEDGARRRWGRVGLCTLLLTHGLAGGSEDGARVRARWKPVLLGRGLCGGPAAFQAARPPGARVRVQHTPFVK